MQLQFASLTVGWRRLVWIALLVTSSVAFSLGFACATPFAAFAAIAALTMTRREALLLVGLVWLANQAVGFGMLHYPWTPECLAWGVALGVVALLATLGSGWTGKRVAPFERLASAASFLAAFAVYEGLLFLISVLLQSGVTNYTAAIVGRIFAINAVAFIALFLLTRLGAFAGSQLLRRRHWPRRRDAVDAKVVNSTIRRRAPAPMRPRIDTVQKDESMIPSPCVGLCRVDDASGLCLGCARTPGEIAMWRNAPEEELNRVWAELPARRSYLGLNMHRLAWTINDVRSFIVDTLRFGGGTWVSGVYGAAAGFSVVQGEAIDLEARGPIVSATTSRGVISFQVSESVRALSFGSTGIVVLAVPRVRAPLPRFFGLTCLGPDNEAIGQEHRRETLYDFGLGKAVGFGVRTARPDLAARLNECAGMRWPALIASIDREIAHASPTRVVRSPLGRIEVFTPILLPVGASPQGPRTHFRPDQLAVGGEVPPALQIPDAYAPCAIHYPDKL